MSDFISSDSDSRFFDLFILLGCLIGLAILAVAVAGGSAVIAAEEQPEPADKAGQVTTAGLVGGGSIGGAENNIIGREKKNKTNPFSSTSSSVQFIASAESPHYWRVDAYSEYENGTWIRNSEYKNYDKKIDAVGRVTNKTTYQISLKQKTATLPVIWQPSTVNFTNETGVAVSSEGGLHVPEKLPAGTIYTVESYEYHPDPRELLISRATYPSQIEDEYTGLPTATSDRVGKLGENITTDTVTPVQRACAIEEWIATNKEYNRTASYQPGSDWVVEYLFEGEAGNAEHAASSMALLLRSVDVPARYVTGYAPGEVRTDDEYGVRAVHAHAWVEVYVSGHGWIPFDPVPTEDRIAVETEAIGASSEMARVDMPTDCSMSVDIEPIGDDEPDEPLVLQNPSEQGNTTNTTTVAQTDDTVAPINSSLRSPNITIISQPTPLIVGSDATVEIRADNEPLPNATVLLDGRRVGRTNETGQVTYTVPDDIDQTQTSLTVRTANIQEGTVVSLATFELSADKNRVLALPSGNLTLQATIGTTPIEGVEIRQDGTVIATTDKDGRATVPLATASTTTFTGSYAGQESAARVENRLLSVLLRLVGGIVIVGVVGWILNREYNLITVSRQQASRLKSQIRIAMVEGGISLRAIPATIRGIKKRGLLSSLRESKQRITSRLSQLRDQLPESLIGYLFTLVVQVYRQLVTKFTDADESSQSASDRDSTSDPSQSTPSDTATETTSVRAVWRTFVRLVLRRVPQTYTPGEIARTAIQKGFPREPVLRLTNTFRAAAYGPADAESATDEAATALSEIETNIDRASDTPDDTEGMRDSKQ